MWKGTELNVLLILDIVKSVYNRAITQCSEVYSFHTVNLHIILLPPRFKQNYKSIHGDETVSVNKASPARHSWQQGEDNARS
jgi:hypothetical protein